MPLPPPWFVRVLPGIGVAVTVAYVGYEVYKQLNTALEQQVSAEEEEAIQLTRAYNNNSNNGESSEELSRLCAWLNLPPDALDCVPSHRLNVCLVLLQQFIPVPARPAFLAVYCAKLETEQDVELLSVLLESMGGQGEENDSAKEQIVVLLKQTEQPVQVLLHTLEVCPVEQRPILLNRMYILWNVNQLDSFLMQLPHHDPARLFPVVEALVETSEESTVVFMEVLTRLHNDPNRLSGLLRALRICPVNARDILLHKLASFSMDRLHQVTLCCARFADAQVSSMVDTLVATTTTTPPASLAMNQSSTGSVMSSMIDEEESHVFSQN